MKFTLHLHFVPLICSSTTLSDCVAKYITENFRLSIEEDFPLLEVCYNLDHPLELLQYYQTDEENLAET